MKRAWLILSLSVLVVLPILAQDANKPKRDYEKRAEKMTEHMAENLNLTEDQKTAVYEANLKKASAKREQRKTTSDKYDADMRDILTEEQYEKWRAMRKDSLSSSDETRKRKNPR